MDRKNVFVYATIVALVVSFAGAASAQEEDTTQSVDWEDAAYYGELMDTFVNAKGVEMSTYYDEAQNVLWSQPAAMKMEEAVEALSAGPEKAGTLLITQWVVPMLLWLCDYNESADELCTSGTNYKWNSAGDFYLDYIAGTTAFYNTDWADCAMSSIERVRAKGGSSTTNYCSAGDSDYRGYYWTTSATWAVADDDSCYTLSGYYYYNVDDSSHITNRTYGGYSATRVVKFRYETGGDIYATEIWLQGCLE